LCSSPWMATVCTSSTTTKSMSTSCQVILARHEVHYSLNRATHWLRTSLYGLYLMSKSRTGPRLSWSADRVCRSKQLHPVHNDTRPGKRYTILGPPACLYGPATSLQKGTSCQSHVSDHI
jgi:hypothetical protein